MAQQLQDQNISDWAQWHKKHAHANHILTVFREWSADALFWLNEAQLNADPSIAQELRALIVQGHELSGGTSTHNNRGVVVALTVGPGGREAADWQKMLTTMYLKWCERLGWDCELMTDADTTGGQIILRVQNPQAMSLLMHEEGVHRLVRQSPFDRNNKTHTSFVHVLVSEEADSDNLDVHIARADVRVDVMRSSGAGGQHVNKTESAVRLTHEPTGIQVVCRNGRSQHQNKKSAWAVLYKKLQQHQDVLRAADVGPTPERGWGQQIRTYHMTDNRVVDHAAKHTHFHVAHYMDGLHLHKNAALIGHRIGATRP